MKAMRKLRYTLAVLLVVVLGFAVLMLLPWWLLLGVAALSSLWMGFARLGQQAWAVAKVGIATIPQRLGASAVVVVGIAGVVGVFVAVLAMGAGFERMLKQTGSDDTAIVLATGARSESESALDNDAVALVSQAPQILRNAMDQPILSPEQLVTTVLPKKGTTLDTNVAIRGVGERVWDLRPHAKIIAGRKLTPGLSEIIAGKDAHEEFSRLEIGSTITLDRQPYSIVGVFDSGDAQNSELWGDSRVIGEAYRREGRVNSLVLRLSDTRAFEAFKAHLQSDPRLKVNAQTTRQYYSQQSETVSRMIRIVGATIGLIMAVGATFGALNATYMAMTGRAREIATLRALGFRSVPVIVSVLLETMLLALLGGAIGAAVTWWIFDGFTATTVGTAGQVIFAFDVSPDLLWNGLKWALAIGFVGGLFPAIRATSLPITVGLREL